MCCCSSHYSFVSIVLDDAFSIKKLGDDTYEVGVHVSDVSYYIKPHSPLDKEARARAASVSLVHKFVPMLPEDLTEKVTNLDPGVTRYTAYTAKKVIIAIYLFHI